MLIIQTVGSLLSSYRFSYLLMLASLASHITALFVHQVWICLDVQDSLLMEKYSKKNSEQKNAQFYIEKM